MGNHKNKHQQDKPARSLENDGRIYEVLYECSRRECGNTQVLRFWKGEQPLTVTCCVNCRAGFREGETIPNMLARQMGMYPTVSSEHLPVTKAA